MEPRTYQGSCHCGAVRFEVETDLEGVLECNCSICTKKGFLHLIVDTDRFRLLTPPEVLRTYTFGTHVAKHRFCARCGMHPFYTPRSHPDQIDVNVRCLDGVDPQDVRPQPFDGRNFEANVRRINPDYEGS